MRGTICSGLKTSASVSLFRHIFRPAEISGPESDDVKSLSLGISFRTYDKELSGLGPWRLLWVGESPT